MLPNSGEILYATDSGTGTATMTWCYPQPRILTAVSVTPVPFNLPQEFEAKYIDESLKVNIKLLGISSGAEFCFIAVQFYLLRINKCLIVQ